MNQKPRFTGLRQVSIVLRREFQVRVQRRSFWWLSFLGPLLAALLFSIPALLEDQERPERIITVLDEAFLLNFEKGSKNYRLRYLPPEKFSPQEAYDFHLEKEDYAFLHIPSSSGGDPDFLARNARLIRRGEMAPDVATYVESQLEKYIQQEKLRAAGVKRQQLAQVKTSVSLRVLNTETGRVSQGDTHRRLVVGYALGGLCFLFTFLYGGQVMRGIMEERQNRMIETLSMALKPGELLLGKILGIMLVALLQFSLWLGLGTLLFSGIQELLQQGGWVSDSALPSLLKESMVTARSMRLSLILPWTLFYTLGAFLLYGSLFVILGTRWRRTMDLSGVSGLVVLPLALGLVLIYPLSHLPDSSMTAIFTLFPLTSPVVTLGRFPFGLLPQTLWISSGLLGVSTVLALALAARTYQKALRR